MRGGETRGRANLILERSNVTTILAPMQHRSLLVGSLLAVVACDAQGGGAGPTDAASTGDVVVDAPPSAVTLTVTRAAFVEAKRDGDGRWSAPPLGFHTFVAAVTLRNVSSDDPVGWEAQRFTVRTAASRVYDGRPGRFEVSDVMCLGGSRLARGGMQSCTVGFQLPDGESPAELVYRSETGVRASATVTATPPDHTAACLRAAGLWREPMRSGVSPVSIRCAGCVSDRCRGLNYDLFPGPGATGGACSMSRCEILRASSTMTAEAACAAFPTCAGTPACAAIHVAFMECAANECSDHCTLP